MNIITTLDLKSIDTQGTLLINPIVGNHYVQLFTVTTTQVITFPHRVDSRAQLQI
ncbi:MAG: hypothetical protein MKZ59_01480 [Deinococcales bacterium]|nr:hypothetical protein [Deinococcales bacterium]